MKKLLPLLLFGLLASCAANKIPRTPAPKKNYIGEFNLQIDSYGEDSLLKSKLTYIMFPENTMSYLEMQEFKKYFVNTFNEKGYALTENYSDAEILIDADWSIHKNTIRETTKIPTSYQTIPVKAVTTQTSENGLKANKTTVHNDFPMIPQQERVTTETNKKSVYNDNSETIYKYDKVATEYQLVENTRTTYSRYLNLTAYSKKLYEEKSERAKLWSTSMFSEGSKDDLRIILPYMLDGGFNYIGHNSGERLNKTIYYTTLMYNKIKGM